MWGVLKHIDKNSSAIKQELWGKPRVSSTLAETKKEEGNITKQRVAQKEPSKGTVNSMIQKRRKVMLIKTKEMRQ